MIISGPEITLDPEKIAQLAAIYPARRVENIKQKLFDAAASLMGNESSEANTLAAIERGDKRPVNSMMIEGQQTVLPAGSIVIGRSDSSEIGIRIPNDGQVSRFHASLNVHADGHITLRDLQSSNGTYVNDRRILEVRLKDGDRIRLGQTILILGPKLISG